MKIEGGRSVVKGTMEVVWCGTCRVPIATNTYGPNSLALIESAIENHIFRSTRRHEILSISLKDGEAKPYQGYRKSLPEQ